MHSINLSLVVVISVLILVLRGCAKEIFFTVYGKKIIRKERTEHKVADTQRNISNRIYNALCRAAEENYSKLVSVNKKNFENGDYCVYIINVEWVCMAGEFPMCSVDICKVGDEISVTVVNDMDHTYLKYHKPDEATLTLLMNGLNGQVSKYYL